ncbi:MAG: hypothetical protein HGN29_07745 [Asgard group archaeon]|nr:hypothetical protein [Asgard group archaeon]
MELNNVKTYLAIAIIGSVVGFLYLIIQREQGLPKTLLFFYITLYIIAFLRYVLERRHYRKHKAVTASTQFLILPFSVLFMGNYISPFSNFVEIFVININLVSGDTVHLYFNLISLSMILPLIVLSVLFNNYFSGKWPAMAVNRKIRRGRLIPFLLFTLFVLLLLFGFFINLKMDFLSLFFAVIYFVMFIGYFIVSPLQKSRQRTVQRTPAASTRRSPTRASASSRQRPSTTSTSTRSRRSTSAQTSGRISSSSASRRRAVTTARTTSAKIAPGKDITTTKKVTRSTTVRRGTKNIFPVGRATKDDLKCIICYMDFKKSESRKVILCPHCKYPAHADEFFNWFQQSKLCARCNKPISTKYVKSPIYRVSTKVYIETVIEKI